MGPIIHTPPSDAYDVNQPELTQVQTDDTLICVICGHIPAYHDQFDGYCHATITYRLEGDYPIACECDQFQPNRLSGRLR